MARHIRSLLGAGHTAPRVLVNGHWRHTSVLPPATHLLPALRQLAAHAARTGRAITAAEQAALRP